MVNIADDSIIGDLVETRPHDGPLNAYPLIKWVIRPSPTATSILVLQETSDDEPEPQNVLDRSVVDTIFYNLEENDTIGTLILDCTTSPFIVVQWICERVEEHLQDTSEEVDLKIRNIEWAANNGEGIYLMRLMDKCDPDTLRSLKVRREQWNPEVLDEMMRYMQWVNLKQIYFEDHVFNSVQGFLLADNFKMTLKKLTDEDMDQLITTFRHKPANSTPLPSFYISVSEPLNFREIVSRFDRSEWSQIEHRTLCTKDMPNQTEHRLAFEISENQIRGQVYHIPGFLSLDSLFPNLS